MGNELAVPLWGVIPIKRLEASKSRLAPILTQEEREQLTLHLAGHVLEVLQHVVDVERLLVVAPEESLARLRIEGKGSALVDTAGTLNGAVTLALRECYRHGAAALVVHSDLPLLTCADVLCIVDLWRRGRRVVICPSCHGGTNAMLVDRVEGFRPAFGHDSLRKHVERAQAVGAWPSVLVTGALSFDLDTPEQWASLSDQLRGMLLAGAAVAPRC